MIQILVMGCKKQETYLEEARAQQKDADPTLFQVITLVADPTLSQTTFDASMNRLIAKCEDTQEELGLKVREAYAYISNHFPDCQGVWKTDDDIRICPKKMEDFQKGLLRLQQQPYFGFCPEIIHKTSQRKYNKAGHYSKKDVFIQIPACNYCYGWGQQLRRDCLKVFTDPSTYSISKDIQGQEDVATGYLMSQQKILPIEWSTVPFREIRRGGGILNRRGTWVP